MKTLDEVITAFEKADARWSNDPHNPLEYPDFCDALHYLKEYRKLDSLDAVAFPEDDNPPLTWSELKQMKGKPVWVEYEGYAPNWEVIEYIGNTKWKWGEVIGTHLSILHKENQGKTWQAYRKERE